MRRKKGGAAQARHAAPSKLQNVRRGPRGERKKSVCCGLRERGREETEQIGCSPLFAPLSAAAVEGRRGEQKRAAARAATAVRRVCVRTHTHKQLRSSGGGLPPGGEKREKRQATGQHLKCSTSNVCVDARGRACRTPQATKKTEGCAALRACVFFPRRARVLSELCVKNRAKQKKEKRGGRSPPLLALEPSSWGGPPPLLLLWGSETRSNNPPTRPSINQTHRDAFFPCPSHTHTHLVTEKTLIISSQNSPKNYKTTTGTWRRPGPPRTATPRGPTTSPGPCRAAAGARTRRGCRGTATPPPTRSGA